MSLKKRTARKKNAPPAGGDGGELDPDMQDVFVETKKADEVGAKMTAAGKRLKACHLLVQEAHRHLTAARSETAPNGIQLHLCDRVQELTNEIYTEAQAAIDALQGGRI